MLYIPPAAMVPEPSDAFTEIDLNGAEALSALMRIAYTLGLDAAGDALHGLIDRELYDAGVEPEDIEEARERVDCKPCNAIQTLKYALGKEGAL